MLRTLARSLARSSSCRSAPQLAFQGVTSPCTLVGSRLVRATRSRSLRSLTCDHASRAVTATPAGGSPTGWATAGSTCPCSRLHPSGLRHTLRQPTLLLATPRQFPTHCCTSVRPQQSSFCCQHTRSWQGRLTCSGSPSTPRVLLRLRSTPKRQLPLQTRQAWSSPTVLLW